MAPPWRRSCPVADAGAADAAPPNMSTKDLATAIADEIERRQRKPTVREQIIEETRKLMAIKVDHNGRTVS